MAELRTAHTADLTPGALGVICTLLEQVFDDLEDADWEHALGGVHALVWDGDELVAHGSVVMRRLLPDGHELRRATSRAPPCAPTTAAADTAAVMAVLERVARGAHELGALGATDEAASFYAARGWQHGPLPPRASRRTDAGARVSTRAASTSSLSRCDSDRTAISPATGAAATRVAGDRNVAPGYGSTRARPSLCRSQTTWPATTTGSKEH